jgi:hypothetical protein
MNITAAQPYLMKALDLDLSKPANDIPGENGKGRQNKQKVSNPIVQC